MSKVILEEQVAPSTPGTNKVAIYPKAGGGVYKKDDEAEENRLLESGNNLADLEDSATAFANIKEPATESATGVVELSSVEEIKTKADQSRVMTPSDISTMREDISENGIEEIWYSAGGEIVETEKSQTLTNKRLTSPKINEDVVLAGSSTQIDDAISKKHTGNADTGTTASSFKINSAGNEADIKTERLTGDRDFNFPDVDGGIVIGEMTANNGVECIAYT